MTEVTKGILKDRLELIKSDLNRFNEQIRFVEKSLVDLKESKEKCIDEINAINSDLNS